MQLSWKEADSKFQAATEDQYYEEVAKGGAGTFDKAAQTSEEIIIEAGVFA